MLVYQLLIRVLSPLIVLFILIEAFKRQTGLPFIRQRLGLRIPARARHPKRIWFHCASVGEVKAAEPLIKALPSNIDIIVTTNTPTGAAFVNTLLRDSATHYYLPIDWPYAIKYFIKQVNPNECWILETEIWPNLYQICAKKNIPITILNARISNKTLKAPAWLKAAYHASLKSVKQVLARSSAEAERFIALGANPKNVHVLGNLKFAQIQSIQTAPTPINRDYVLLASSHADEEFQISQAWLTLNRSELLVIVPRHPKRSPAIQKQLQSLDNNLKVASKNQQPNQSTNLFLDDRMGKLPPLFEHAKLVIMGGSFSPKGGHNVLEPAAYQKTIITGPDMSDFEEETALLLHHHGIIQCHNYTELTQTLKTLIDDQDTIKQFGQNAYNASLSQSSILAHYLEALGASKPNKRQSIQDKQA